MTASGQSITTMKGLLGTRSFQTPALRPVNKSGRIQMAAGLVNENVTRVGFGTLCGHKRSGKDREASCPERLGTRQTEVL